MLACVALVGVAMVGMLGWFAAALVFRRRFQFGIRTLLVLVVAVALPCNWMAAEIKGARGQHETVSRISKKGWAAVVYDSQLDAEGIVQSDRPLRGPQWLRMPLGDEFFNDVVVAIGTGITDHDLASISKLTKLQRVVLDCPQVTDAGMAEITKLTEIELLSVNSTRITDKGLAYLAELPKLRRLNLEGADVTDANLATIARLTELEQLRLDNTQISDAGLAQLAGLTELRDLSLNGTRITDAGLPHLAKLLKLQSLWLDDTKITDAGLPHLAGFTQLLAAGVRNTRTTDEAVKKLKRSLPNCRYIARH